MTDKEIFQELKQNKRNGRRKLKAIKFLKTEVNRKLVFSISVEESLEVNETTKVDLLRQLEALEINEAKIRGNKFNSEFYSFEPSRKYNFK